MLYNKWVACWGNATSITDRKEAVYAKDITLRYPIFMPFSGSKLRLRFSNLTGTEPVSLSKIVIATADGRKIPMKSQISALSQEPGTIVRQRVTSWLNRHSYLRQPLSNHVFVSVRIRPFWRIV